MAELTHTAQFNPAGGVTEILEGIACPGCGYREPADSYRVSPGNRVRFFCDGCGAFVTIVLSDRQADAVRDWSFVRADRA